MSGSVDGSDGRSLERIEQAMLADDPDFVRRLRRDSARLSGAASAPAAPTPASPSQELRVLLGAAWGVAASLVLLCLAGGWLVGAAGTCVLALVLHRQTRRPRPVRGAAPPLRAPRAPGRSTPAGE